MINPDNPIDDIKDDIFNFKQVSGKIATNIKSIKSTESLTISIEGEWGNGKTSLSNLISSEIKNDVVLISFNPWMVVDFKQLTEYFFSELMKEIKHEKFEAKLKEDILKDLKKFASIFTPDTIEIKTGIINTHFKPKETFFNEKEETLYELKEKINSYLSKLPKRILIVIDDIDRLTDKETETFFRLIKGIADFKNIIYLLLYDKTVVSNSLENFKEEKGEKYLDKIVQYSITVPKPHKYILKNELFKRLDEIIKELETSGKKCIFDSRRWSIAMEYIDVHIKNLRDINKIVSTLSFEYPLISDEVNFVDFFVISLIKIQNIKLYNSIKNNPRLYFEKDFFEEDDTAKERILEVFEKEIEFKDYKNLLSSIFPFFREYGLTLDNPHKEKYIANIDNFENYFSFDVSPEHINNSEYIKVVSTIFSKYKSFKNEIIELDNNKKSSLFVDMFIQKDLEILSIPLKKLYKGIINILRVCSFISDRNTSFLGTNPIVKYFDLSYELIKKSECSEELIKKILKNKKILLYFRIDLFKRIKKDTYFLNKIPLESNLLDSLESKLVDELSKLTLKDILKERFGKILILRLEEFKLDIEELKKEFELKLFKSKEDFFEILKFFKYWQKASDGSKYLMDKQLMKKIFDMNEINTFIKKLKDLTKEEQELLDIYKLENHYY